MRNSIRNTYVCIRIMLYYKIPGRFLLITYSKKDVAKKKLNKRAIIYDNLAICQKKKKNVAFFGINKERKFTKTKLQKEFLTLPFY